MKALTLLLAGITGIAASHANAEPGYPPLSKYMMEREAEVALARSAAPENISSRASVKVFAESGYEIAIEGNNGFVCMVMRGWTAPTYTPAQFRDIVYDPTVRAPICFNAEAVQTVMPYYEFRTKLGMAGKTPDEMAEMIEAAYVRGEIPRREAASFAYMWSADQHLGPGIGHWHPHMMIFAPYYENAMLGDNAFGSPMPQVTDDAGTPFTVVVIPVDDALAVKAQSK